MRSKSGLFLGLLLFCLTALLFFTVALPQPVSAERVLTSARDQLIAPQPGQIIELSSTIWRRPPPARLELSDPYHAPFTLLWPVLQEETRWIELDADGNMIRWRTQLRNEAGQLQQELLFVDGIETVFSARDQHLDSYPSQIFPFHDQRQVLIDAFLQESTLQQEDAFDWEGKPVTAVSVVYDQNNGDIRRFRSSQKKPSPMWNFNSSVNCPLSKSRCLWLNRLDYRTGWSGIICKPFMTN